MDPIATTPAQSKLKAALHDAHILLSNDDGVAADGLKSLHRIAQQLSPKVTIAAPEFEQSGAGHSLTTRRPLRVREASAAVYAIDGTPTDAVLIAVTQLLRQNRPDLVLSGVNRGGNMGEDVTYSGTVAAAMEATLLGIPAIALSQAVEFNQPVHWDTVEHHAPRLIRQLVELGWPPNVLINLNFPDCSPHQVQGVRVTRQGLRDLSMEPHERLDPRGMPYYWIDRDRAEISLWPESDVEAVRQNYIAITPLCVDFTDLACYKTLQAEFH
ncbi:MAG: 5'/3'-nucleotidase SurE [Candidatus Symbiobacter sp.]|nr:5'/3'-nucleotidase SurE [Candidatus Symbiobacter sp.]